VPQAELFHFAPHGHRIQQLLTPRQSWKLSRHASRIVLAAATHNRAPASELPPHAPKDPALFKNATLYRIGPHWAATLADTEAALAKARFTPCGASQPQSLGWVEPRGVAHGPLVESVSGQWLLRLMVETRVLPGVVVKRRVEEIMAKIEHETGRKPGRKQAKEIKEEAVQQLLPQAFTKQSGVSLWVAPAARLLLVDAGSQTRADAVVSVLTKTLTGFEVALLQTTDSAASAMAEWLVAGEAPSGFALDRECELKAADEMKSVVRYARHALDIEEIREHITTGGKRPTRLALTWQGRVSFTLTEAMQLRKIAFLDGVFEGAGSPADKGDDAFDADATIATGELGRLIPDLLEALGGELPGIGLGPAVPAPLLQAA